MGDDFDGDGISTEDVRAVISGLAEMISVAQSAIDQWSKLVGAFEALHGDRDEVEPRTGAPQKYPWQELEALGEFFWPVPTSKADRIKIVRSITSGANKRYGPGKIKVKRGKNGVWVFKKGEW